MSKYIEEVGSFRCQVVDPPGGQWFGESGEKKTPYIAIRAVVTEQESSQYGAEITFYAWLTDGAIDRTVKDLQEVFGWDGDMAALDSGEVTFVGMECVIVTESDSYEGKTRIKAKFLNSVHRQAPVMAREKVSSLISRLNSRTKAVAKSAGPATASRPTPQTQIVDAPF